MIMGMGKQRRGIDSGVVALSKYSATCRKLLKKMSAKARRQDGHRSCNQE
jgi:hypothetical protein